MFVNYMYTDVDMCSGYGLKSLTSFTVETIVITTSSATVLTTAIVGPQTTVALGISHHTSVCDEISIL